MTPGSRSVFLPGRVERGEEGVCAGANRSEHAGSDGMRSGAGV